MTSSTITGNVSRLDGGGLSVNEENDIRITSSLILGNVAKSGIHNDITSNREPKNIISDFLIIEGDRSADSIDNTDFSSLGKAWLA